MWDDGSKDISGLDGPKVATEQYIFSCQTSGNLRECISLEVPDRLPKEMGDGLDQLLIKPSSEVIRVSQSASCGGQ